MLEIKELIEKKAYNDALAIVNRQIGDGLSNPFLWNVRGDLIQLADENCTFSLRDAEMSYHKALEIDPRDLRALESLAYYYDRVGSNLTKAKEFAEKFVLLVEKSVLDMKDILGRK